MIERGENIVNQAVFSYIAKQGYWKLGSGTEPRKVLVEKKRKM